MSFQTLRKNQRWLMILVASLVIISFVWFYNRTELDKLGRDRVGEIYGRSVNMPEVQRIQRLVTLALQLGLPNLSARDDTGQRPLFAGEPEFIWNWIVLKRQAEKLGVMPTDDEVASAIQKLPAFQRNGGFDGESFTKFLTERLGSQGFGQKQVEEVIRADIQFGRIRQMLDATAVVGPNEVRGLYDEYFSKVEAQVVRLKLADFAAAATVTEEDLKKYFEDPAKKPTLQTDVMRKVKYVSLSLTEEQKKLPPAERRPALQKLADQMEALSQGLLEAAGDPAKSPYDAAKMNADLAKVAAPLNLPAEAIKETPEFNEESLRKLPEAALVGFDKAALSLTPETPVADPVQGADTFQFLVLSGYTPARPLTFEEAKPKIEKTLREQRGREAMNTKAAELLAKIGELTKAGKSFTDAATEAGVKADAFPAFSMAEPSMGEADALPIMQSTQDLGDGETVRKAVPLAEGAAIVHVVRRTEADMAKFETMREGLAASLRARKRALTAREWLLTQRTAANVKSRLNELELPDEG